MGERFISEGEFWGWWVGAFTQWWISNPEKLESF
jgi:hypothetical protein